MSNDPVELKLEELSASERTQLKDLLETIGAHQALTDIDTTLGAFKIPYSTALVLRSYMEVHPSEVMSYWRLILDQPIYASMISPRGPRADPVSSGAPLTQEQKKTSSEQVLSFILAADKCGLSAKHDPDARTLRVEIFEGHSLLVVQMSLETGFWTVALGPKPRAATKLTDKSEGVQTVLASAYHFYEALDPDGFENGLEQLLTSLLKTVEDWYNL